LLFAAEMQRRLMSWRGRQEGKLSRAPALLALLLLSTPVFSCDGGPLFETMEALLPAKPGKTFDVAEVGSTEGGSWDVYFAPDGKTVVNLVRNDYGEAGRRQTRLVVSSPDAWAITDTTFMYSAPNYVAGVTTIREEKDFFVYCSGHLYLPEEPDLGPGAEYPAKAAEVLKTFDAPEVAEYVQGLKK
jgi:hypothetical protein